jgi:hypothetical protein
MAGLGRFRSPPGLESGFTLVEALVATLLLATCLIPAAYALRDAVGGPGANADAAHNLDCVSTLMETLVATPYDVLAGYAAAPSSYPGPNDTGCPARKVTIQFYGNEATQQVVPGNSAYLLYVSVSLDPSVSGNPYTLTTLVAR